ncbi:MAG: hypothetical protein KIT83_01335 [Bryobacterales bacterium]|nr:hypothetical protein [Bryobacterales bacterium]
MLHGLPSLSSKGFVFEGLHHSSYVTEYTPDPDCLSHYTFGQVVRLAERSSEITLEELRARACADLHADHAVLEFSRDVVWKLVNPATGVAQECFLPLGRLSMEDGKDPADGTMREVVLCHGYHGDAELGGRRLDELGLPLFDVVVARAGEREIAYLMAGDAGTVLGDLSKEAL